MNIPAVLPRGHMQYYLRYTGDGMAEGVERESLAWDPMFWKGRASRLRTLMRARKELAADPGFMGTYRIMFGSDTEVTQEIKTQEEPVAEGPDRRRTLRRLVAAALVGGLVTAVMGAWAGIVAEEEASPPEFDKTNYSLLRNPDALRAMGLCAKRLALQARLEQAYQSRVPMDAIPLNHQQRPLLFRGASDLAVRLNIPCVPENEKAEYTYTPPSPQSGVRRAQATDFVLFDTANPANWCDERERATANRLASPDIVAVYYEEEIQIGNEEFLGRGATCS